jgi:hypothetical protein
MPIINEKGKRTLKPSELRINWGKGRLSGYESFYGFAAKFCRLNELKTRQFREFWTTFFPHSYQENQTKVKKISRLLHEPQHLVRTVFGYNHVNSHWPQLIGTEFDFYPTKISFCPQCISEGYYASFHEHRWLKSCPIHCIELKNQEIPYLSSKPKPDKYLLCLISLLDLNCPGWHLLKGKYRIDRDLKKNKSFYNYLIWLKSVERLTLGNSDDWIAEIGCNDFSRYPDKLYRHNYFIIKYMLGLTEPVPDHIMNLFPNNRLKVENINIQTFSSDISTHLFEYFFLYPNGHSVNFFRFVQALNGECLSYVNYLKKEIERLCSKHSDRSCECTWGINQRNELINCLPGELRYYGRCICPKQFAINELTNRWLSDFSEVSRSDKIIDYYTYCGRKALVSDIVKQKKKSFQGIPIYQFTWGKKTTYLLDLILCKIVEAHVEELKFWLLSIEKGKSPVYRVRFQPNIYLVHNTKSVGLQLVSWEAGIEHKKLH